MYKTYNPVAWKVIAFPGGGGGSFKVTYAADFAFIKAQVDDGVVDSAAYSTRINVKEQTTLTLKDSDPPVTYAFSKPEPWAGAGAGQFECHNKTGAYQDIGVGFFVQGHQDPATALVIQDVPNDSSVSTKFIPILSAYVVTGYQQTQIIKTQIQSKLNWEKDLTDPSLHLYWRLEENALGYELVEDDPAI